MIPKEINNVLKKYEVAFNRMDSYQIKDFALSLDAYLSDMQDEDWDWEAWNLKQMELV